jgi:hypothetical protein
MHERYVLSATVVKLQPVAAGVVLAALDGLGCLWRAGAPNRAFSALEEAVGDRDPYAVELKVTRWADPLRDDPAWTSCWAASACVDARLPAPSPALAVATVRAFDLAWAAAVD